RDGRLADVRPARRRVGRERGTGRVQQRPAGREARRLVVRALDDRHLAREVVVGQIDDVLVLGVVREPLSVGLRALVVGGQAAGQVEDERGLWAGQGLGPGVGRRFRQRGRRREGERGGGGGDREGREEGEKDYEAVHRGTLVPRFAR